MGRGLLGDWGSNPHISTNNNKNMEIIPAIMSKSLEDFKKKSRSNFIKNISKANVLMLKGSENELRRIIGRK